MPVDIFATKGLEYLLVIGYFVLLIAMVRYLLPRPEARSQAVRGARAVPVPWFSLADGFHFHQGHSWAAPDEGDTVTVGLDDFTAKLVGEPDVITLPAVGERLRQGGRGWMLRAGDRELTMVSPVDGEVVAVNAAVLEDPRLAAEDPYGGGWLLRVRTPESRLTLRNLLSGELAAAWMRNTVERLRRLPAAGLGEVMPDGGVPVRGFGRALGPEEWEVVARDLFLTS